MPASLCQRAPRMPQSQHRRPAVDRHESAGRVPGEVADHGNHGVGDVIRLGDSPQRRGPAQCCDGRMGARMRRGGCGRRKDAGVASDVITLPDGRRLSWHEFGDPGGSPVAAMRRELASPARRERALQRDMAATSEAAHAALRIEYEAVADALRRGTRATVQELALTKRPWPFPLSEVKTPVHLWHGARDRNAPIAYAHRLARELPDATLHVSDSSGHDVGLDRSGEIMSVLASHAR